MILGFKPQFKDKILAGTQIHTIRRCNKYGSVGEHINRLPVGTNLEFVVDECVNFPSDVFKNGFVVSTQLVFMTWQPNILRISVGQRELDWIEKEELAVNSGFDSYEEFHYYFKSKVLDSKEKYYYRTIIHWTDKRY